QDEQRFGDLRNRNKQNGMPDSKRLRILRHVGEIADKRRSKGNADLQREAKKHRKKKKDQHFHPFEKYECVEAKGSKQTWFWSRTDGETSRERKGIDAERQAGGRADIQLKRALLPAAKIDYPHGEDKTDRAPYPDRREIFDGVEAALPKNNIRYRVVERD